MPLRPSFGIRPSCNIAGLALFVLGLSISPAKAGFEVVGFQWIAPSESMPAPAPAYAAPVETAPGANQPPESLSPVVVEGNLPPAGASSAGGLSGAPSMPITVVHGFANNVPLAVALREVLPPGYNFSIDQGVDMGTPVSFKGGKPWMETLQDMLQSAGLAMRQEDRMIYISHAGQTMTMPAEPVITPAPQVMAQPTPATSPIIAAQGLLDNRSNAVQSMPSTYDLGRMATPQAPMANGAMVTTWSAQRSDTLHKVLEDWCRRSNVELDWLAEYDYPIEASISLTGTFEDAVRSLLGGFESAHPQPIAELHNNASAGQKVLVVETRGNSYSD